MIITKPDAISNMNEKAAQLILARHIAHIHRYPLMLPNCHYRHDTEADLLCVRKSGFCDEFEIKLTRADFMADAKKQLRASPHTFRVGQTKLEAMSDGLMIVNYFWYAVPDDLVSVDEIPDFAGMVMFNDTGRVQLCQMPKRLHRRKLEAEERYKLALKSNNRYWNLAKQVAT